MARRKWPLLIVLCVCWAQWSPTLRVPAFINLVIINNIAAGSYTGVSGLAADVELLISIYAVGWVATYGQSAIMVQLGPEGHQPPAEGSIRPFADPAPILL